MKRNTIITLAAIIGIIGTIAFLEAQFGPPSITDTGPAAILTDDVKLAEKAARFSPGVDFVNPSGFINSEPFTLKDVVGKKVILIDFWTYSCINCIRTQPYLNAWHKQYEDDGLLIIGVHTPEFDFERDIANVRAAVDREEILYPVVLDNDYATWRAYGNRYWPRKYLIDIDGFIVYNHIGEGSYEETEEAIRSALEERRKRLGLAALSQSMVEVTPELTTNFNRSRTPELYYGTGFDRGQCGNCDGQLREGVRMYTIPVKRTPNSFYFAGTWNTTKDYSAAMSNAQVILDYTAKDVYAVLGTENTGTVRVYRDGVFEREIVIEAQTLYTLVQGETYSSHELRIELSPGVQLYTYTFG